MSMCRHLYTLIVVLFSLGPVSAARADNGHHLLKECGDIVHYLDTGEWRDTTVGGSYCLGMVNGMMNLNFIYQSQLGQQALFCLPESTIVNAEAARVVVSYLKRHPEQLDSDQGSLMFFAFRERYPCQ